MDIIEASNAFKGSCEEKSAILKEIVIGNGSIIHVFNSVPFTRKQDESRIIEIIQKAIENNEIPHIRIKKLRKNY